MKINTKYSLNDRVFLIESKKEHFLLPCTACSGEGFIDLNNGKRHLCPECYGRKSHTNYKSEKWLPSMELTIGKITASTMNIDKTGMFDNIGEYKEGNTTKEIVYMAYETGIGTGTNWPENRLFSDKEQAQVECDKRNKEEAIIK